MLASLALPERPPDGRTGNPRQLRAMRPGNRVNAVQQRQHNAHANANFYRQHYDKCGACGNQQNLLRASLVDAPHQRNTEDTNADEDQYAAQRRVRYEGKRISGKQYERRDDGDSE